MYPTVTAIVVARTGAEHLKRTLDALTAQTRRPDSVIVIDVGSSDKVSAVISEFAPTHFLVSQERLPFGAAVATAARVATPPTSEHEWLWLLAQDTAPEPTALEALLGTVEVSPSVAIAGPKLVDWDDTALIRDFGESMTQFGASVPLVQDELDQAQHDGLSDVLGVASGGMIVRHTAWEKLGGFDRGLPVVDDGLDLSVRARLAGFRVVLVPSAIVASAGDGVAGPSRSNRWSNRRRLYRERRAAQLHRRMVYSGGGMLFFHWLSLVPLAIIRSIVWLLGKQPGAITGEFAAAFGTAFGASHIGEARSALARTKSVGWSAIAPLRIPLAEVRRARALRREANLMRTRGERKELNFFSGGGAWVVLGMLVVSVGLFVPLLSAGRLAGGGLLPLSASVGELWQNIGYGWRDIGLGFVGAADPFAAVLAILGSLTFWNPSFVLVLLWFAALPIAALGAWFCATRITDRPGLRAVFAIAWALAPMLFDALQTGRPAALLAHLLLPWLIFAAFSARRSWTASAATSLLAAATAACAPSLAPALAILWLIWACTSGRSIARVVMIPIPTLVLFGPLVVQQVMRGSWLSIFADPGAPVLGRQAPGWQLALGIPDGTLGGWHALTAAFGLPEMLANILVPALLAPIAILALLALFLRGTVRAVLSLIVAFLGFATAVAAIHVMVAAAGSQSVPIWPGPGLSLYWLGLTGAAVMGLSALGKYAVAPAWVALVALAGAVVPLAAAVPLGTSAVRAAGSATLPAYVTAEAGSHPRVGTLRLTPAPDGGIAAQVVRGAGETLDDQSTLSSTTRSLTDNGRELSVLAGNLASSSGLDASADFKKFGIGFVLLAPPATTFDDGVQPAATATATRSATALDGNPLLASVGTTDFGQLWSVKADNRGLPVPPNAGGWMRPAYLVVLGVVFGLVLLLSIPTGRAERGVLRRPAVDQVGAVSTRAAEEELEPEVDSEVEPDTAAEAAPDQESAPDHESESQGEPDQESGPQQSEAQDEPKQESGPDQEPARDDASHPTEPAVETAEGATDAH
jgi:GT2 family glycosyltransferase